MKLIQRILLFIILVSCNSGKESTVTEDYIFLDPNNSTISISTPATTQEMNVGTGITNVPVTGTCDFTGTIDIYNNSNKISSIICEDQSFSTVIGLNQFNQGENIIKFEYAINSRKTSDSFIVNVDTQIPTTTIDAPNTINQANETSYIAQGSCSENGRAVSGSIDQITFSTTCSNNRWVSSSVDLSFLVDNTYVITTNTTDANGNNSASTTANVIKDTVTPLPGITYVTPASGFGNAGSVTFKVSSILNGDIIHVYDDSACTNEISNETSTGTSKNISLITTIEATYIYYFVVESGGNFTSCLGPKSYVEDKTAPSAPLTISLTNPANGSQSNNSAPSFTGTTPTSEENATVSIYTNNTCTNKIGDGTVSNGSFDVIGTLPIDGSAVGINSFYVDIIDLAGNKSSCFDPSLSYELQGAGLATLPKLAMVGSNSPTMAISLEDNNTITHIETNGTENILGTFNKGDIVPTFNVDQGDRIESTGACYAITQGYGTAGWASEAYAGSVFTTYISRYGQFYPRIYIASVEGNAYVQLKQNNVTVAIANVAKNTIHEFNTTQDFQLANAALTIVSTKKINVYFVSRSSNASTYDKDARVLTPAANDIIGFAGYITSAFDTTSGTLYEQDGSNSSFTISTNQVKNSPATMVSGDARYATIVKADKPIALTQIADSNGINASPSLPLTMLSTIYGIPRNAAYVSFMAPSAGSVKVYNPSGSLVNTYALTRTSGDPEAPFAYKYDPGTVNAGHTFECTTPCYAMYDDVGPGADSDETLMIGYTP